ncbi:Hypothetical predicted protein [Paramuricea clavata]|uniref:Uncharacterized protein n=1 Tax=Paramuricea clavata TaxID=317549 RepID=A0A6S7IXN2_PARCT|nr:Hypothetical predicted protein [Paramuricea clavata]
MVNMVASRKATKNMDNAISSEQIWSTKNLSTILSEDDMENKNVFTGIDQCMSGSTHDLYAQQVYKNVNHLKNVCQSALCTDFETNPGPVFYIDPSKTISAPYSQELPSQLTVFYTDYIFEYSESYSGNVIGDCSIEGYQFCVPFHRSFELLLAENYSAFILTIDSNAVCIFSTNDGKYKIFYSYSRDIYGRSHPQGTCVLLEAPNINNVILYFQSLYGQNSQFELRGINIEEVQANGDKNLNNIIRNSDLSGNALEESESTDVSYLYKQCCAISYSICYSVIKPCNYWDSNTVAAVVYFGTTLYNNTGINTSHDIPQRVEICGNEIHVKLQTNIQGVVDDKAKSKLHIESLICHTNENTGFLIWFGDYCISCIFQKTSINNMSYSILAYDDDDSSPTCTAHYIKNIKDKHTLVDTIFKLVTTKIKDEIVNYEIQFLSCSSELSNCERKRIMKNHRQNYINDFIEPALKKQKLETKQMKYKTMAQEKKQKILENRKTKYEKLDESKKEEQLTKNMNYRKTMNKGPRLETLYCATEISVAYFFAKCASRRANFKNLLSNAQFQNEAQVKLKMCNFSSACAHEIKIVLFFKRALHETN